MVRLARASSRAASDVPTTTISRWRSNSIGVASRRTGSSASPGALGALDEGRLPARLGGPRPGSSTGSAARWAWGSNRRPAGVRTCAKLVAAGLQGASDRLAEAELAGADQGDQRRAAGLEVLVDRLVEVVLEAKAQEEARSRRAPPP